MTRKAKTRHLEIGK